MILVAGKGQIVAGIFAAVLATFGAVMLALWPTFLDKMLSSALTLSPDSLTFQFWREPPIPVYVEVYLFNWTNPEDFGDEDEAVSKPKLVELGPYVFRTQQEILVKEWVTSNNTLTFRRRFTFFFEPELSKGNLEDVVTTVNVPAVVATHFLHRAKFEIKLMLETLLRTTGTKLHVTRTAREILVDGYTDPLIRLAAMIPSAVVPGHLRHDRFGYLYIINRTTFFDGVINMFTGGDDFRQFGEVGAWNYKDHTVYKDNCGELKGSAAGFLPPNLEDVENISVFVPWICRSLTLTALGVAPSEVEARNAAENAEGKRYILDETIFDNTTTRPDNWCYCPEGSGCPPNGVFDVSTCQFGAPAFLSLPHFYLADPSYRQAVDGMKPNASIHQSYIDVIPRFGVPLQLQVAIQANILIEPQRAFDFLNGVPKTYFPCLWVRAAAGIPTQVKPLVLLMSWAPTIGYVVFAVILCTGLVIFGVLALRRFTQMCKRRDVDDDVLTPS